MGTNITNSTFTGVKWDGQALEAVNIVAMALLNMTELFKSQNIEIECLLKVNPLQTVEQLEELNETQVNVENDKDLE